MKTIDEFKEKQKQALAIQEETLAYIKQCVPEFERNFYFTKQSKIDQVDGNQIDLEFSFNFYLPDINQGKVKIITAKTNSTYFLSTNKLQFHSFKMSVLKTSTSPEYAFLMLNIKDLPLEILNHFYNTIDKRTQPTSEIQELDRAYLDGTLVLEKQYSSKMSFTDFLIQINNQHIKPFLTKTIEIELGVFLSNFQMKVINDNYTEIFDQFICSLHERKNLNPDWGDVFIDNILKLTDKHDKLRNFTKLHETIPAKPSNSVNRKI